MRPKPGRTAEALAMGRGFRFRLACGFHHAQARVARLAGVLPLAVIDSPLRRLFTIPGGRLHAWVPVTP